MRAYALSKEVEGRVTITGFTSINKMDVTQHTTITYRSNTMYRNREWSDWGYIYIDDNAKGDHEVDVGQLMGFVRFDDENFSTPLRNLDESVVDDTVDKTIYMVVRCCGSYKDFDANFVTEFELMSGKESLNILPVSKLM